MRFRFILFCCVGGLVVGVWLVEVLRRVVIFGTHFTNSLTSSRSMFTAFSPDTNEDFGGMACDPTEGGHDSDHTHRPPLHFPNPPSHPTTYEKRNFKIGDNSV